MENYNEEYRRWAQLIESGQIPKSHPINLDWGVPYCDRFCKQLTCPQPFACHLSLLPGVKEVSDKSWISPSDHLIKSVKLKPPLTNKYIKAQTHRGILSIGHEFENEAWNRMEQEKARALDDQEMLLRFALEKQKHLEMALVRESEAQRCTECMIELEVELQEKLREELAKLEERMLGEREELLEECKERTRLKWESRLDEVCEETVTSLTLYFLELVKRHSEELEELYIAMLSREGMKLSFMSDMERIRCHDMLSRLKRILEGDNIANLMYLLCRERHKCQKELDEANMKFNEEATILRETSGASGNTIKILKEENEKMTRQMEVREAAVVELLKKYRKLIYFALKASPTQAEFLLNLDKLIKCELDGEFVSEETENVDVEVGEESTTETYEESIRSESIVDENQLEQEKFPSKKEKKHSSPSDALPAFYYKNKMYVREDYRNLFSRGLQIDSDHSLWNKEVESLMQILRTSVSNVCHEGQLDTQSITKSEDSPKNRRSSVHFPKKIDVEKLQTPKGPCRPESVMKMTSSYDTERANRRISRISMDSKALKFPSKSLMSTRNSLELIEEKKQKSVKQTAVKEEDEEVDIEVIRYGSHEKLNDRLKSISPRSSLAAKEKYAQYRTSKSIEPADSEDLVSLGSRALRPVDSRIKHRRSLNSQKDKLMPTDMFLKLRKYAKDEDEETVSYGGLNELTEQPRPMLSTRSSLAPEEKSTQYRTSKSPSEDIENFGVGTLTPFRAVDSKIKHRKSLNTPHEKLLPTEMFLKLKKYAQSEDETPASSSVVSEPARSPLVKVSNDRESASRRRSRTSILRYESENTSRFGSLVSYRPRRLSTPSERSSLEFVIPLGSRLSVLHRDSLTVMKTAKSRSVMVFGRESTEVLDGLIRQQASKLDAGEKKVKVSHVEVVDIPEGRGGVAFNPQAVVVADEDAGGDVERRKLEEKRVKKSLEAPKQSFYYKIAGDLDTTEHLQSAEEFSMQRIDSMLAFLERYPSLIKTFEPTH